MGGALVLLAGCGGQVEPTAGATFRGPIETGAGASAGTITFTVSDDGASITDLGIQLTDVACDGLTIGSTSDVYGGSVVPLDSGGFSGAIPAVGRGGMSQFSNYSLTVSPDAFPVVGDEPGQIDGKFSSAGEATGTITIHVQAAGTDRACELGTFPWSATAS